MKNILAAFYHHMPPFGGGAALRGAAVAGGLADEFSAEGFEIHVVTSTGAPSTLPNVSVDVVDAPEAANDAPLRRRAYGEVMLGVASARVLRRLRPRLVLISSPAFLSSLVLCTWCRLSRTPYVLEVRDIYPQVYAGAGLLLETSIAYRVLDAWARWTFRGARRIVTVTHGLQGIVSAGSAGVPVVCIHNGFPLALGSIRPAKHKRFTACFHGVLGFFQDIETLLLVAGCLEAAQVDIVVIGYGRKEDLLRQQAPANLRFLGRLSFEETIREVARCHVGLCLRRDGQISIDAFPIKAWEYMGLGIPTIATPRCEAGEFMEKHGCGMQFPAGAVRPVVDAIMALRSDAVRYEAMAGRCASIGEQYTREGLGRQVAREMRRALR